MILNLLGAYEEKARSSLQGRQQNQVDVVQKALEFCWPNKDYHAPAGKKRVVDDDLTLPQWIVGQLSNI